MGNRLVEVIDSQSETTVARYEYDGLGRRTVVKFDSQAHGEPDGLDQYRHFFYSASWQVLETRMAASDNASPDTLDPEWQYVWSPRYIDAPVLRDENKDADGDCIDGDDERLYYLTDANMNVMALVADDGTVAERYAYDPYGVATTMDADWTPDATPDYDNRVLWCGYWEDWATGLYHVRHRVYHAPLGRWMQRDPAGYVDGLGLYAAYFVPGGLDPLGLWDPLNRVFFWLAGGDTAVERGREADRRGAAQAREQARQARLSGAMERAAYKEQEAAAYDAGRASAWEETEAAGNKMADAACDFAVDNTINAVTGGLTNWAGWTDSYSYNGPGAGWSRAISESSAGLLHSLGGGALAGTVLRGTSTTARVARGAIGTYNAARGAMGVATAAEDFAEGRYFEGTVRGLGHGFQFYGGLRTLASAFPGSASSCRCPSRRSGGRLGGPGTRAQVRDVADELENRGWQVTGGGGRFKEEYLPGSGGARTGSNYVDVTATRNGRLLRVNTIDTLADGVTPTGREAAAAASIRAKALPREHLLLIPKGG